MSAPAISIAILAGGESKRFGSDKVFANFRGMPLIKHLIWRFREHTDDLFIVSRFDQPDRLQTVDIPIVYDSFPERTIMGAIIDALQASKNEWTFVIAVDLPLINWSIVQWMASNTLTNNQISFVIPELVNGSQPLCAFYKKECIELLRKKLDLNQQRMRSICDESNCFNLSIPSKLQWQFLNMNTLEDLKQAEQLAEKNQIKFIEFVD